MHRQQHITDLGDVSGKVGKDVGQGRAIRAAMTIRLMEVLFLVVVINVLLYIQMKKYREGPRPSGQEIPSRILIFRRYGTMGADAGFLPTLIEL